MWHWCYLICVVRVHWLLTLNSLLFRILLPHLFANNIMICFKSAAHCHWFLLLCICGVLAHFEQVIVLVYCFWHCLLIEHWFVQCQQHLCIGVILQYNSGSVDPDFEQVTVSIRLLFHVGIVYLHNFR